MLDELHVKDLALIRDVRITPAPGLTVITGETGAGKSALVNALALLAGGRADAGAVREGAPALQVEGRFMIEAAKTAPLDTGAAEGDAAVSLPTHLAPKHATEHGLRGQEAVIPPQEIVVSRQVTADGRSRVHLDGSIASVGQLAEGPGATIDLCGQHEHQRLMQVGQHRTMLDNWAFESLVPALEAYARAFVDAEDAAASLEQVKTAGALSAEAVEQARFTIARIDEVAPQANEYDDVRSALARAENAESLASQLGGAHEALAQEGGAIDALAAAAALLEEAAHTDEFFGKAAESLREASYVIEDVSRDVRSYRDSIDYDARDLAAMQERMGQLQGLLRSFGPTMDEVFAARERAQASVAAVDEFEEHLARAKAAHEAAEEALATAAAALHDAHAQVAPQFAEAVTAQMQRLDLAGATLECTVDLQDRASWSLTGPDHIEFLFRPGAGMSARPLVRIASGGEISRVMLAVKVVLGAADSVDTLVFDEVDAGVGGAAARALAEVLADLARSHQLVVITHLPQVAVLGDAHYVVRKSSGELPETTVEELHGQARVAEVARMLSGDLGGVSRAHAAQMLEEAHQLHR